MFKIRLILQRDNRASRPKSTRHSMPKQRMTNLTNIPNPFFPVTRGTAREGRKGEGFLSGIRFEGGSSVVTGETQAKPGGVFAHVATRARPDIH